MLYGEGFNDEVIERATSAVQQAELIVIVGTRFQVHPFCDVMQSRNTKSQILVINQEPIQLDQEYDFLQTDGAIVFEKLSKGANYDH